MHTAVDVQGGGVCPQNCIFASQMRRASEFLNGKCISIIFKQLSPPRFAVFSDTPKTIKGDINWEGAGNHGIPFGLWKLRIKLL